MKRSGAAVLSLGVEGADWGRGGNLERLGWRRLGEEGGVGEAAWRRDRAAGVSESR